MKKLILVFSVCLIGMAPFSAQDTDPTTTIDNATTLKFKIFKLALSTSAQCTSPITVFESTTGLEADLIGKPTFGKGKVPSGTYPCIMVEASKIVNATSSLCTATNSVVCSDTWESKLINGTSVTCSGGVGNDQRVVYYFTTLSATNTGSRILLPPTGPADTTSGISLASPGIVFPTNKKAVFKVKKQIVNSAGCSVTGPTFSLTFE